MAGPELLLLGSAALGGVSAFSQASQQQANARFQQNLADRNARQAALNAQVREQRSRRQAERASGRTRAAFGASGVRLGSGTPLDVLADQAMELEQNILLERFGGQQQAASFQARSEGFDAQADRINPLASGAFAAGGSLLTSVAGGGFDGFLSGGGGASNITASGGSGFA